MTIEKKAAPKLKVAKRDAALCHYGAGSYGSLTTSKKCPDKLVAGKQLCAKHEVAWKVEAKRRDTSKKRGPRVRSDQP